MTAQVSQMLSGLSSDAICEAVSRYLLSLSSVSAARLVEDWTGRWGAALRGEPGPADLQPLSLPNNVSQLLDTPDKLNKFFSNGGTLEQIREMFISDAVFDSQDMRASQACFYRNYPQQSAAVLDTVLAMAGYHLYLAVPTLNAWLAAGSPLYYRGEGCDLVFAPSQTLHQVSEWEVKGRGGAGRPATWSPSRPGSARSCSSSRYSTSWTKTRNTSLLECIVFFSVCLSE